MSKESNASKKKHYLMYRGRPLVRSGNSIFYGEMSEEYVAYLQILSKRQENNVEVADKVAVQLLSTNEDLRPRERIQKKSEKKGLYEALNIASIWLNRSLSE